VAAPLIGIAPSFATSSADGTPHRNGGSLRIWRNYPGLIAQAGAIPVILPLVDTREEARALVDRLDGLVLTGGHDIDPARYGQNPRPETKPAAKERVASDLLLAKTAHEAGKPALGICLGLQTMNVVFGGTIFQHIPDDVPGALQHEDEPDGVSHDHAIRVERGTLLHRLLGVETAMVNSFHHQGLDLVAPGFQIAARAEDGVVEAIERSDHPFYLGVQWHPERSPASDVSRKIVRAFVDAARGAPLRA
jgi:putative glutamine amidotransferase